MYQRSAAAPTRNTSEPATTNGHRLRRRPPRPELAALPASPSNDDERKARSYPVGVENFVAADGQGSVPTGTAHAVTPGGSATLCGIAVDELTPFPELDFDEGELERCPECSRQTTGE